MSVRDALHQPLKFGGRFIVLVLPQPQRTITIPSRLKRIWIVLGFIDLAQVIVQRFDKRSAVLNIISRPEVIRVIIGGQIDGLLRFLQSKGAGAERHDNGEEY